MDLRKTMSGGDFYEVKPNDEVSNTVLCSYIDRFVGSTYGCALHTWQLAYDVS